jgi:putative ABC transport system permease protein
VSDRFCSRGLHPITRLLRNDPGYVSLASGVLALAIGINVLVFSIVNALWLRPLPVVDPARVITILQSRSTVTSLESPALKVFDGPVAGQVVTTGFNEAFKPRIAVPQVAEPLETLGVTPLYFSVLGVSVRGRVFTDADERIGAEAVGIISDRLWARAFGRSPGTIGSVVAATPRPLRIIGIAPPGFAGARRGERAELWVPTQVVRDLAPDNRQLPTLSMMVFARLRPGQTMAALEQRYRQLRPLPDGSQGPPATAPTFASLTDAFGTSDSPSILIRERGTLAVVSGLSLLVLLGGCATIAALVLTHYERRRPELAIKASLGAGRARLARELLAEALVVALAGSAGAIVCGLVGQRALPALSLPGGVNIGRLDLSLDWRLSTMALAATIITLGVASAVPLWKVTHGRLAGEVSSGPATTMGSLRARRRLLALQVCATTVVLIASGLFVRTVLYSFRVAAGFDIDRTVFVTVQETSVYTTPGADPMAVGLARRAELTDLLEQLPSVHAVAGGAPPIGADARPLPRTIRVAGREERVFVGVLAGTPNLLSTLGVPLLAGRALDRSDAMSMALTPVVITRSLAERFWASADALGQMLSLPEMRAGNYVVVGIADNFAFGTLSRPVAGVVVTARGDWDFRASNVVLQTDNPSGVVAAVPNHLAGRVVRAAIGREIVGRDIAQQRLGAWVFSGFGLVALLLGIGGVFGLVAYLAQARRREFGVRMALGATLSGVVRNAVTAALSPVAVGVAMGLLLGAIVSQVFTALLVGIDAVDPGTYAGVGLVMLVPAALAALAAAWRLRRLTLSDALRRG